MVEVNLFTLRAVYLENGESKPAFSGRKPPSFLSLKCYHRNTECSHDLIRIRMHARAAFPIPLHVYIISMVVAEVVGVYIRFATLELQISMSSIRSLSDGALQWPWQYHFPPFFTIQPNSDTKAKQLEAWCDLVLAYHRATKSYVLDVRETQSSLLFCNDKINRILGTLAFR